MSSRRCATRGGARNGALLHALCRFAVFSLNVGAGALVSAGLFGCAKDRDFREGTDGGCAQGAERCACYGNGTCDDGLSCLSNRCVDVSASSTDEASPADPDASADDPPDEPNPPDEPAAPDEPTLGTADEPSVTPGQPDAGDGSQGAPTSSDDPVSDDPVSDDPVSDDPVSDDPVSDDPVSDEDAGGGVPAPDDTGPEFAPVPTRVDSALDAPAQALQPTDDCPRQLDLLTPCVAAVACDEPSSCRASFEWVPVEGPLDGSQRSLVLRGLSGDGSVLLGDDVVGTTERRAFVWRWGNDALTYLTSEGQSSATAINFDGTAAVGAVNTCLDADCSYEGVRWTAAGADAIPRELGLPTDIADESRVCGYERTDGVIWGYLWDGAEEPVRAELLVLQQLSGDGRAAAGVADGGPVVLFHENGTTAIPPTGNFRPDIVLAVSQDAGWVLGYGWDSNTGHAMFRWQVGQEVELISPLPGFEQVVPFSIDAEASVMVGENRQTAVADPAPEHAQAFYWDEPDGLRPFVDELAQRGLQLPDTLHLHAPRVSADGSTVVGTGNLDGSAIFWRARLAL